MWAQASALVINEIVAENNALEPADIGGGHPDMIELYNGSSEDRHLGASELEPGQAYALSDTEEFDPLRAWTFPLLGSTIAGGGFLVVFCDNNPTERDCELHASFQIDNNGSEPISLWGPEDEDGNRPLLDRVWLPPLRNNHSFGRFPDGAGPAPVPVEETFDVFRFSTPENTSFGTCIDQEAEPCTGMRVRRACRGAPNASGDNLEPRVSREAYSATTVGEGESLNFVAQVKDDGEPTPGNIATVQIRYSVNGVAQSPIEMQYDAETGVQDGSIPDPPAPGESPKAPQPLDRWTFWDGSIPGLPANSRVVFEFFVEDAQGKSSFDPRDPCPEGVGPCDNVGLPGPGCVLKPDCEATSIKGCKFTSCDLRRQFLVGYSAPADLSQILINEIVPAQTSVLRDPSEPPCPDPPTNCKAEDAFEDFFELVNVGEAAVDLSGLWVSDRPFHPQGWQFPPGSSIDPGEYLVVWADNDGGKCPRPLEDLEGDGQECPDPTDPTLRRYHTNFNLEGNGDQVILFEETPHGFGIVHQASFGKADSNVSWSLSPDATRGGTFEAVVGGSPGNPNGGDLPTFLRGDTNLDCTVDLSDPIFLLNSLFSSAGPMPCPDAGDADDSGLLDLTDAIFSLNFQFQGGQRPLPPGPDNPGPDPSQDSLRSCESRPCP